MERLRQYLHRLLHARLTWIGIGAIALTFLPVLIAEAFGENPCGLMWLPYLGLMVGLPALLVAAVAAAKGETL